MKRTLGLLLVVISAAAVLSGCGVAGDPAAAKVGSSTVSRSELDDDLQKMGDNEAFTAALKKQGVDMNPTNGGVSAAVAASWLNALVNQSIIDQAFDRLKLTVTPEDRTAAKAAAPAAFFGETEFAAFPESFRKRVLARQARTVAVKASLAAKAPPVAPPTDEQLAALFEQAKANCPSGKVVSRIVVQTQADADAIGAELLGGADFADVAKEKSIDTTSSSAGGLLACVDSQSYTALDPAIRAAADVTPVGSVSAVVKTNAGFEILKVSTWDVDSARPILETAYQQQTAGDPLEKYLNRRLLASKVWVDPRYGTLRRSGATVTIIPPRAPKPKSEPADTPSSSTPK